MERLAARAGVGKQTLYRWWPSKAAVVLEAYLREVDRRAPPPKADSAAAGLRAAVKGSVAAARSSRRVLPGLIAEAQSDPAFAEAFRASFVVPRRRKLARLIERAQGDNAAQAAAADLLADMIHGAIWYRLLAGHAPLDQRFADALVAAASA